MSNPIFEQSTSSLYYSNDGLLHVIEATELDDAYRVWNVVRCSEKQSPFVTPDEVVLSTKERVLADAYIAGYDLATSTPAS